jgi:hypothetical protein
LVDDLSKVAIADKSVAIFLPDFPSEVPSDMPSSFPSAIPSETLPVKSPRTCPVLVQAQYQVTVPAKFRRTCPVLFKVQRQVTIHMVRSVIFPLTSRVISLVRSQVPYHQMYHLVSYQMSLLTCPVRYPVMCPVRCPAMSPRICHRWARRSSCSARTEDLREVSADSRKQGARFMREFALQRGIKLTYKQIHCQCHYPKLLSTRAMSST